jgi:hypothetical protein
MTLKRWGLCTLGFLIGSILGVSATAEASVSNIQMSNTDTTVSYQFSYSSGSSFYQVFIDTDVNSATGYKGFNSGIGADWQCDALHRNRLELEFF